MSDQSGAGAGAFDRGKAESDLHDVMFSMGIGSWSATSEVEGVAVYVCEDLADTDAIKEALEARGHAVEQVVACTWIVDGGTDDEVIAVAFDVPGLPDEWRLDNTPSRTLP